MRSTPVLCALLAVLASATTEGASLVPGQKFLPGMTRPDAMIRPVPIEAVPTAPRPARQPGPENTWPLFSIVGGLGSVSSTQYDHIESYGVIIGHHRIGRTSWGVCLMGGDVYFADGTVPGREYRDAADFDVDLLGRWYLGEPYTNMYGIVGAGIGGVAWDYPTPRIADPQNPANLVADDDVTHYDVFAGMGGSIVEMRHMRIAANVVGGARFYDARTGHGFDNRELPSTAFARLLMEVGLRR